MNPSATSAVPRLTYGITPPKRSTEEPRRREIAAAQSSRIAALPVDALIVYDLQDESSRTDAQRPFPFMQAVDPLRYAYDYLGDLALPRIVYRAVSGQSAESLEAWLKELHRRGGRTVLVGAPSRSQLPALTLAEAYRIRQELVPALPLGGVLIAERHEPNGGEEARVFAKVDKGCSFFVTQAVYSVTATKNVLSDLYYHAQAAGQTVPPLLLTLSPCGSERTLRFTEWLGVSVPRWLRNELLHAGDILERSVKLSLETFQELHGFAVDKGLTLGCNVESVSLSRAEIDASVELVHQVARIQGR